MGRRCCITGCSSRSSAPEHHGVTYHSFPLDANIRGIWVKNTRLQSDRNITKSVLVCSRHFRRADFQPMKSGKYLLKQRVFPTVFPWGKIDHNAATNMETSGGGETSDMPANDSSATSTPHKTIIPTGLTTTATDTATTATVEATIAQIMAETAELNAAAGIKKNAVPDVGHATTSLEKRQAPETYSSSDESPIKQPRSTVESTPVLPIAANVSPATRFEAISVFNPGARLEAQDFDGAWHSARVVEVDNDDREVLIKFEKSGKQHKGATLGIEEWIPMNSTRLRQKVSTKPLLVFDLEEKVMARWTGARRFPATIKKILSNDMYEVLFDDGFVKNVRSLHMSKILPAAANIAVIAPSTTLAATIVTAPSTPPVVSTPYASATSKPKKSPVAVESSATKVKRAPPGQRRDWPLLSLDKLDIASLNLPEIPKDGEWTCHWVNDQPIGKEGFLIVGEHKKPTVVVEDWRLPPGWVKHMYQRSNVLGKWDVILVTPNGKRFRSKADLKTYLEEQGQVYNPDIYDFSIHRRRAKDINAYAFTSGYSPQQPKKNPTLADTEIIKSVDIKVPKTKADKATAQTTAAVLASTSSNFIEAPVVTLIPPMELMTPLASTSTKQSPVNNTAFDIAASSTSAAPSSPVTATTTEDGFALIGGLKVQIVDNLFRCPQEGCAKNFRKENHLQIHVKHYHPDLIKLLGDCPKMQELAEKRTLGTPDSNEPLPKNQIPNQEFFAKLHQQDLEQSRAHRRSLGVPAAAASAALAAGTTEEATDDATVKVELTQSPIATSAHITASDTPEIGIKIEGPSGSTDKTHTLNATTDLTNTTADSSLFELSVVSSTNDESAAELPVTATAVITSKRSRFSPSKRTPGSRKSNRQRTTRRYLTAAQATAGAPLPPVNTSDSGAGGNFGAGDFEETRHSFNATPDAKQAESTVIAISAKRRKAIAAPTTPLSSLDSPVTADSGSSLFQTLADDPNGSTVTIAAPQYIKENGELIKIVRMRQEEIINCLCSYGEEDGLMIQCELCLCWQHGICNGIDKESDVPDKYVCYICRNPQRGRECMRYKHDQDWLYEGKLPVASYHNPNPEHITRFELLKKSHTLTGNLVELKRFMHSLRVKINIANNKGHPKMYLWAKKWDEEQKTEIKSEQRDQLQISEPIKIESNANSQQTKSLPQDNTIDSKESHSGSATSSPAKRIKLEPPSTPDRAVAPTGPPLPLVPNIPQPEAAIEPVECQNRLLDHIKVQQLHVMERLSNIEAEIDELEKMDTLPDLKNADLSTTKDVLSTFIKELEIMKQISKINALENLKQSMNDNSVVIK